MKTLKTLVAIAILLPVLACTAFGARAQTVNKWVDKDGVTHFSDQKPAGDEAEVSEIEIPKGAVSEFNAKEVNDRLNTVLQQMEQDRKAREAEAAARKKSRDAEKAGTGRVRETESCRWVVAPRRRSGHWPGSCPTASS